MQRKGNSYALLVDRKLVQPLWKTVWSFLKKNEKYNYHMTQQLHFCFFKGLIYLFFRQRGREGERGGEKHQCVIASCTPPTGDLAQNPSMCPDWESNQRPFGSQAGTQPTEPHQPGPLLVFYLKKPKALI